MELLYAAASDTRTDFVIEVVRNHWRSHRFRTYIWPAAAWVSEFDSRKADEAQDAFQSVLLPWRIILRSNIVFQAPQNFFLLLEKLICFCFVFFPSVRLREWKLWIMLLIDFHPCKWTHHIQMEGNSDAVKCGGGGGGGGTSRTSQLIYSQRTRRWRWSKQRRPCCTTAALRRRSTGSSSPLFPLRVIGIDSNFVRLHRE